MWAAGTVLGKPSRAKDSLDLLKMCGEKQNMRFYTIRTIQEEHGAKEILRTLVLEQILWSHAFDLHTFTLCQKLAVEEMYSRQ